MVVRAAYFCNHMIYFLVTKADLSKFFRDLSLVTKTIITVATTSIKSTALAQDSDVIETRADLLHLNLFTIDNWQRYVNWEPFIRTV